MFELALAHINRADREREIEAALRRRLLLKAPDEGPMSLGSPAAETPSPRAAATRLRTAGR